jgi:hypothetical protein
METASGKRDWQPGDLVRIKGTGDKGRVIELIPGGSYRIQEMAEAWNVLPLGEEPPIYGELGIFTAEELEPEY